MDTNNVYGLKDFGELVYKTRTFRRFDESQRLSRDFLLELVDLARMVPNSKNKQVLRYRVVTEQSECDAVFEQLGWAAQLPDWKGPEPGERPAGYIIIVAAKSTPDKKLHSGVSYDVGIASQTMMLAARAATPSVGCCMLRNVRPAIMDVLGLSKDEYEFREVLAFGVPGEEVVVEPIGQDGDFNYWHGEGKTHHVPKRSLEDVLINRNNYQ